jgi:hypothetical protein
MARRVASNARVSLAELPRQSRQIVVLGVVRLPPVSVAVALNTQTPAVSVTEG